MNQGAFNFENPELNKELISKFTNYLYQGNEHLMPPAVSLFPKINRNDLFEDSSHISAVEKVPSKKTRKRRSTSINEELSDLSGKEITLKEIVENIPCGKEKQKKPTGTKRKKKDSEVSNRSE